MKTKKLIAIALTAIMTLSMAGCGTASKKSATTSTTNKKLVIWAWDGTFNVVAAKEAKAIYEKDHKGVDVQIVEMAQNDIVQKLNTNLSSNTTAGLPNIVLIEDYRSQNFLTSYPDSFKDMSSKVKTTDFMDYKLKSDSLNGKLYGVPFDSGAAALFYRTDLIEKAGYKKSDMENITWEKFIEIGKAVKAKTGKAMLTMDPNDLGIIRIMMQSAGQWYVKDDGKTVNLENNVALKESIKIYKQLMAAGITKQVSDWDQFVGAFQKGDVASVPSGCWISSSITKATDQSGKWAVAAIPKLGAVKTSVNASNVGGSSWYVLDKVGDSELASDFLAKTFGTNKELMNTLSSKINLISTLKSSSTTANYQKPVEFYGGQKTALDLSKWTTQIPPVNYGLYTYSIEDILTGTVQSIVKSGADIDKALKDAQKQAESAVVK
ncbi:sugar ABC transporter substrate-binding protein [Clostridium estertheticum]|uniref:sugar ABC transporter substrate-binding protein n=1 Tax=Clostridium estertheticum TaxID=238834 RepID=UPI001C7CEBD7|nr:extracellular solute-binding protein [Clostridium estertheticum]MBX4270734.1 extracellular solute-binding protein [Clostridium estertheticum]WLC78582.1 extracellular solute-binding protein [Clostridium estertheticum]